MLSQLGPKERFGYLSLAALLLFAFGMMGSRYLRQPAPIVFQQEAAPEPQQASAHTPTPETEPLSTQKVIVHVAGAVKKPGLLEFTSGERVQDAIDKAGGPSNADLNEVNLAAKLEDGTQLYIPKKADEAATLDLGAEKYHGGGRSPSKYSSRPKGRSGPAKKEEAKLTAGCIALNSASAADLDRLPGVGPATAQKILAYRKSHGAFSSIDQLLGVKGIGPKKLADIRPFVRL